MIEVYRNFLAGKTDTWRKAKQFEYNSLDKILLSLQDHQSLKTRNAMTLRILGLVNNVASDELELTPAAEKLISSVQRQQVLDEQLLKIYLDSYVNSRLQIPVYPLIVIFQILKVLQYITFEEYRSFVCWIHSKDEVQDVISLIKNYRQADEDQKLAAHQVFLDKVRELGVTDFADNVYRLYAVFKLSSFISTEEGAVRKTETLFANSSPETYDRLIQSIRKLDGRDYAETHGDYLGLVEVQPEHIDLTEQLQELSQADVVSLRRQIKERRALPDILSVNPQAITPRIVQKPASQPRAGKTRPKKIDYVARDARNSLVGRFGEQIVHKYEYEKLVKSGLSDLALKIDPVSETDDSLGYDILSFTPDDIEKHIEVKAVKGMPRTFSFYISKNELDKVKNDPCHCIYIVFDYESTEPKIWELTHLDKIPKDLISIEPTKFQVTLTIET